MTQAYHQLVKRLLDGELSLSDLPPELRAEGAEALRLLGAVDRTPVLLPLQLDARVMAEVRRRARSPVRRAWRRLVEPRDVELRLRVRPWVVWAARSPRQPPSRCSSPGRRRPRAAHGWFARPRATACTSGSCCTLRGPNGSRSRGRSTNGTRTPRGWCGWEPTGSGRSRWRCPRASTSTPSWWMVSAGSPIRLPPVSMTGSDGGTVWSP